jgi:acyl carrier protein
MCTSNRTIIQYKTIDIIKNSLDDDFMDIDDYCSFQDLGINSFTYIRVIASIEKEFNIKFEDEYLYSTAFNNLAELFDVIQNKLGERN